MKGLCLGVTTAYADGSDDTFELAAGTHFEYVIPHLLFNNALVLANAELAKGQHMMLWLPLASTAPEWPAQTPPPRPGTPEHALLADLTRLTAQHVIFSLSGVSADGADQVPALLGALSGVPVQGLLPGAPGVLFASLTEAAKPAAARNLEHIKQVFEATLSGLAIRVTDQPQGGTDGGPLIEHLPINKIPLNAYPAAPRATGERISVTSYLGQAGSSPGAKSDGPLAALYLADGPGPDDIHQGRLGDCYLLALLADLAYYDPSHIKGMIGWSDGFQVRFWRMLQLPSVGTFVFPQMVHLTANLACKQGFGDPDLLGARLRAAGGQLGAGGQLTGARIAAWAPLLEKAFAGFAARFGLIDRDSDSGHPMDSNPEVRPDYLVIGGGAKAFQFLLRLVYGPRMTGSGRLSLGSSAEAIWAGRPADPAGSAFIPPAGLILPPWTDPEARSVTAEEYPSGIATVSFVGGGDPPAGSPQGPADTPAGSADTETVAPAEIDPYAISDVPEPEATACRLLRVLYDLERQTPDSKPLVLCTASTHPREIAHRLAALLPALPAAPASDLAQLSGRVAAGATAAVSQPEVTFDAQWHEDATSLLDQLRPQLQASSTGLPSRVCQLLLILLHAGVSSGDLLAFRPQRGQYVFAGHSYALTDTHLAFTGGPAPDVAGPDDLRRVNDLTSTVRLRNPHHQGSPNLTGTGTGVDTGVFDLTLRDFLAVFTDLSYTVIS